MCMVWTNDTMHMVCRKGRVGTTRGTQRKRRGTKPEKQQVG